MVSNSRWLLQRQEDRRDISFCSTILSTWLPSCVTHTHTHTGLHTYLAVPSGLCPSSPTKGQTWAPEVKVPSPDYWTTREFPSPSMKCYGLKKKIGCWSSSHCILSGRRKMRKRGALSSPAGPEDYLDFPHNFPFYLIHPR